MSKLICPFDQCKCCIIPLEKGTQVTLPLQVYKDLNIFLPTKEHCPQGKFLMVNDVWDFDNIGVSRNIPDLKGFDMSVSCEGETVFTINRVVKYLICADCDKGPLGIVCEARSKDGLDTKVINLLSLESVKI